MWCPWQGLAVLHTELGACAQRPAGMGTAVLMGANIASAAPATSSKHAKALPSGPRGQQQAQSLHTGLFFKCCFRTWAEAAVLLLIYSVRQE